MTEASRSGAPAPLRPPGPAEPPGARDWAVDARPPPLRAGSVAAACAPGALLALVAGVLAGPVAAGLGLAVGAAGSAAWVGLQGRRALRRLRPAPAGAAEAPRLLNLVEGLAEGLGEPVPSVWIADEHARNALVCRSGGRRHVVVTRALLEEATRTELEAVVAHCILRLQRPLLREALGAAYGRLGATLAVDTALDARTAAVTRYPPGLAAAVSRSDDPERLRPFWFAAEGPTHAPRRTRIDALADL